jgi:hypothetical protein
MFGKKPAVVKKTYKDSKDRAKDKKSMAQQGYGVKSVRAEGGSFNTGKAVVIGMVGAAILGPLGLVAGVLAGRTPKKEQVEYGLKEGRTLAYSQYLSRPHWQQIRDRTMQKAHDKCQVCGSRERLTVHHKTYKHLGKEHDGDLVLLCHRCHKKAHGGQAW